MTDPMKKILVMPLSVLILSVTSVAPSAGNEAELPDKCVKCHEWEDWEGLSIEDMIAGTQDKKNKKHKKKLKSLGEAKIATIIEEIMSIK